MHTPGYLHRRNEIAEYFDRTAADAWAKLTSDAPLGRIRATVRAGRERMRATLLDWLPRELAGRRVLDAGCGTGLLAIEAARRGAHVVAIDLSPTLIAVARERYAARGQADRGHGRIEFRSGDMTDDSLGPFDHVVAMDSLIHYPASEAVRLLARWAQWQPDSMLFTHAPRTPLLAAMHATGRLFPRGNRSPSIVPVSASALARTLAGDPGLGGYGRGRSERIISGFYMSQAVELKRS